MTEEEEEAIIVSNRKITQGLKRSTRWCCMSICICIYVNAVGLSVCMALLLLTLCCKEERMMGCVKRDGFHCASERGEERRGEERKGLVFGVLCRVSFQNRKKK